VRAAKWEALAGNTAGLAIQVSFIVVLGLGGARVAADAIVEPDRAPADLLPLGAAPAAVAFDQVHFRYRPELPEAHRGLSFAVPARGMTAFVGPSGAGKTTVFSLIERFYEATSGQVLVDGRDVTDWPLAELRAAIGYVEQDAPVLSGTLRENLLLGAPEASDDELAQALGTTRLTGQVARLPRIIVLDAGRVRVVGTHAELLGADPLYAELAATQFLVPAD
jgi:ABC-type multidrug transport system fused ATPase/permease subunit